MTRLSVLARVVACFMLVGSLVTSISAADPVIAILKTSKGTIKLELDAEKAPLTVGNFVKYAEAKHYDNTIFHRVIPDFMVQGGGMTADMKEKATNPPVKNESFNGLINEKYTVAMARTPDPDSATSQFFINVKRNSFLDKANARDGAGYCVFGKVIEGKEVVDEIAKVKTSTKGRHDDVPVEPVMIEKVEIVAAK
ncbi:MAG: peptidylprolyl isomerase [Pirellulales bacterium]